MIERAGVEAGFDFKAHPHMLRHACGFALANAGHDTRALQAYLGHKNIQHTVRYTELVPNRFKDFWRQGNRDGQPLPFERHPNTALHGGQLCLVALSGQAPHPRSGVPRMRDTERSSR
jgi:Phage integrase family